MESFQKSQLSQFDNIIFENEAGIYLAVIVTQLFIIVFKNASQFLKFS